MSVKQKLQYFWDYYRVTALVIICLAFVTVTAYKTISSNLHKYNLYCILLNDVNNTSLADYIGTDFPAYLHKPDYKINIDNGYPFSYLKEYDINWPDESSTAKFMSLTSTGKADVAISDYNSLLWAVHEDYAYSLDEVLPAGLLLKLKPYYVYADFKDSDGNDGKIYGLDISGTEAFKSHKSNYSDGVVFLPKLTAKASEQKKKDRVVSFIEYLFHD
ncbi:hypothetical protein [Anaerocolumna xylanovorans]|uniref:Extracellular solute-binding protein n=1 Tax=Anaerocolumna xylanovorans DSM 12503 TaxID=1121345 RepID=A0A1M7YN62_9FIRM|nr:hypothetical protein [Anaerocolumna xylanovorans]SHO53968.1 hypothetical protein SAMN02745217_04405 [Anaerocolumna xylanovorans DSM 12503]